MRDLCSEARVSRTRPKAERKAVERCGPTNKRLYRTRGAARAALAERKRAGAIDGDTRRQECRIYPCLHCGGFHLSSQAWAERVSIGEVRGEALVHNPAEIIDGVEKSGPFPTPGR